MVKITRRKLLGAIASALALPLVDFYIIEPELVVTCSNVEFKIGKLPSHLQNYKIAHISDTHFGSTKFKIIYDIVLSNLKSFKPSLIAYTGDLISKEEFIEDALKFAEGLAKIAPTYIVWGNWDHWSLGGILKTFKELLESISEVKVLLNENIEVEDELYIVGVDDPYTMHDDFEKAMPKAKEATYILLAHSPEIIGKTTNRVDIIFTGHTHGGQVILPIIGPIYVPLPSKYRSYVSGLFKVSETYMYVTRGIGTSILPVRFMCPPEVVQAKLM